MKTKVLTKALIVWVSLLGCEAAASAEGSSPQSAASVKAKQAAPHTTKKKRARDDGDECAISAASKGTSNNENGFDHGIGCSTRASIEAMVENPADLQRGRGTRYSDGERAAQIVTGYRNWKAPAGDTPKAQTGDAKPIHSD